MSKLQELKTAIKNTPPVRLASIEYKNNFYLIGAYIFAGAMLYREGLWFIIPILLFSSFISFVNGVTAYNKYSVIKQFSEVESPQDFDKDISPTRRRSKIINYVYGKYTSLFSITISVIFAIFVIDPTLSRWRLMVYYPSLILPMYVLIFYIILYEFAQPIYKHRMKNLEGVKK